MCGAEAIKKLNEWRHRPAQTGDSRTINSDLWVNKEMMLVGLSASAADDELEVAFENGMHFFCPKPVETTMLASILMMRRKASSLQSALSDIGKQAVSMNSTRIIAGNPSSQSKAQIKAHTGSQPCWNAEEDKQICTGESADVVVCRGNTGWRLFKQISRLLSGDKTPSDKQSHEEDNLTGKKNNNVEARKE
jgi:CheY-like chemotaxis protein